MSFDYKLIDPLIKKGNIVENYQYIHKEELIKACAILEQYCKNNPNDYDAKLSLAVFVADFPSYDDFTAIKILNELLLVKGYYIKALVIKAEIETIFGIFSEDTFQAIEEYCLSNPIATLYYGEMLMHKAFYLRAFNRYEEMEHVLLKSIKISPSFAWNYMLLGDLMVKQGKNKEANDYYKKALDNTTLVDDDFLRSPYDFEMLLDELLRGTIQWSSNYNRLMECFDSTRI
jgi:tetratricopeptide (TPR) repeat protein